MSEKIIPQAPWSAEFIRPMRDNPSSLDIQAVQDFRVPRLQANVERIQAALRGNIIREEDTLGISR